MKFEIQEATIDDLKTIQELNLALFKEEYDAYDNTFNLEWTMGEEGTQYFSNSIVDETACALVVKSDEKIIGYLVGWIRKNRNPCRHVKKQAELENMFVVDAFRSRGVGRDLVDQFIDWAKLKEVDNVTVTASAGNLKGIKFYKNCGFDDYDHTLEINLE